MVILYFKSIVDIFFFFSCSIIIVRFVSRWANEYESRHSIILCLDTPMNGSPVGSYTDQIPAYALSGDSTPSNTSGSDGLLPLTAIPANDGHGTPRSQGSPAAKGSPSSSSSSSSKMFASTSSISNDPPPGLPPHLEKVILNNVPSKEDNSVLPVPNHVVLNHLYACSVKEGVLSISVTARYRKKYITTVFIKPVVTDA